MGRREEHGLLHARFILRENIHEVAEVAVQAPGAHGGTEFKRGLEGNDLHIEPRLFEESFIGRSVKNNGVCRRQNANA